MDTGAPSMRPPSVHRLQPTTPHRCKDLTTADLELCLHVGDSRPPPGLWLFQAQLQPRRLELCAGLVP